MNSARQIPRLAPGAPRRAPGLRSPRCTPPSQYRSLSSRVAQPTISESAACSTSTLLQRQPLLRSTLPANALRLNSISLSHARSFHVSGRTQQKEAAAKEAAAKEAAEKDTKTPPETKEGEPEKSTESKEESKEEAKEEKEGDEKAEGKEKEKKEDLPPPPPHGDKTPWQVFLETMDTELKQSKEWNESTKALASSANEFVESERVRKARQAYEATSGAVSSTAAKAVKSTAGVIGKGATWTWDTPVMKGVRKGANKTGEALDKATKPIRETEAYRNVKDVIDDGSSSRYGGWVDKEERKRRRELREQMDKKNGVDNTIHEEDPNAGTNVTLHKDAAWKEAWRDFRDQNKFVQGVFGMKSVYQESENPLISTARSITDKVAGFFAENETAMVIKRLRAMDPAFKLEPFLQELREYILPEVLDAYVKGDVETLKLWLSEAQYSVYEALTKQYLQAGLKSDGKILDIRGVDILRARMLDPGEIPVFIVTCRTQEVHVYRNAKSNELAAGMEDKVQLVTYAIGITRIAEDVNNPETRGWRLIEMQKSGRDYI
ncbi:hypothetical protein F5144DRAFT_480004 [Chaetomium tenue]|uniref:Uncharacterized protein n=1 Tax=Chaetomium tenue TaxID=1854479 RepID=A0ACB7PPK8_9PEZI|nr:hypothetical protein F5144DRAFT_480004 [Chaetomium globosum]